MFYMNNIESFLLWKNTQNKLYREREDEDEDETQDGHGRFGLGHLLDALRASLQLLQVRDLLHHLGLGRVLRSAFLVLLLTSTFLLLHRNLLRLDLLLGRLHKLGVRLQSHLLLPARLDWLPDHQASLERLRCGLVLLNFAHFDNLIVGNMRHACA